MTIRKDDKIIMSEKIKLSKNDRLAVAWRSTFLQGSWNYERMQNLGWAFSLIPAIKKLYTTKEDRAAALTRHMEFFNTHIEKGLFDKLSNILENDFAKLSYTDAIDVLLNCGEKFEYPVKWGIDLQSEHERYLAEVHFKKPVFLINYPKDIKAFYMKLNEDGKTVKAMDLLVPGIGEIIGGSQREDNLELLLKRMDEMKLNKEDYGFYLDLRRFGSFPHSGYGLGFERMMMYLTGMTNIRDVVPFPRTPKNAEF